ncbi:MAG: tetratricopeptide repeat protein [Planctomycetes bacterium]|nr:tetratricopeptide repeat protein [Planctomycetota bacterium]
MNIAEIQQLQQQAWTALQRGDYLGAESAANTILARKRNDIHALVVLAQVALAAWRYPDAVELQTRAVKLDPKSARLRIDLANMQLEMGSLDKALMQFDKALKLEPRNLDAISGKAGIFSTQNKYERALRLLKPFMAGGSPPPEITWICLHLLVREKRYDEAIEIGRRVLDASPPEVMQVRTAWFELARAYERRGDTDAAFAAATRGNAMFAAPFDPAAVAARIDRIMATFTRERLASLPHPTTPTEVPVFIVGVPRCGSTLTERIIHAHPLAHGAGEHIAMFRITEEIAVRMGSAHPYPRCCEDLTQADVEALSAAYIEDIGASAPRVQRIANKDLGNYFHLGLIEVLFPRGRVIHCRRDVVDTCLSCYMEPLPPRMVPFASDLEMLGRYYREYERLMEYWRDVLEVPFLEVDYEALVNDQEATTRQIIDFCGLPWDDACLRFHEVRRAERTLSLDQVRKPVYRSSVGRAERFGAHLDPLRAALAAGET